MKKINIFNVLFFVYLPCDLHAVEDSYNTYILTIDHSSDKELTNIVIKENI